MDDIMRLFGLYERDGECLMYYTVAEPYFLRTRQLGKQICPEVQLHKHILYLKSFEALGQVTLPFLSI